MTECPRCGGPLDHAPEHDWIGCTECDQWATVRTADPEAALRTHDFAEIVEHSRPHADECLCVACRYVRQQGAEAYI